jgi:hypothetical protein
MLDNDAAGIDELVVPGHRGDPLAGFDLIIMSHTRWPLPQNAAWLHDSEGIDPR